jgi:chromosome segregation protein
MRLQAIKLAGFKSFVDPTVVPFRSNLCAVVGPNGCGKSNIIDAVRWVMGESSAKTLRGESMSDVIFNGSTTRKPVGQANIELVFDNVEGRLSGEYAAYNEISIKRQVTRDGQSNYYLNGQKCRRKDITDIFLGTGMGPRSYSIIEQGMISSLIEARPEELRVYIEEAAGISKYKERRRETERRITHTRDNLDRLSDLREEMGRQLHHLERQARAAERYTELKQEEREVKSQLQALKWRTISADAKVREDSINRLQVAQDASVADLRRVDASVEEQRQVLIALSDETNEVQKRFYDIGTEIARIEDTIQFQNERNQQLNRDLEEVSENWYKVRADIDADQRKLGELRHELNQTEPQQEQVQQTEEASAEQLSDAEQAMQVWQQNWETFNQGAAEAQNKAQVQQSRIGSMEQSIERLNRRLVGLKTGLGRLEEQRLVEEEIGPLAAMLETQEDQIARSEEELTELVINIETQREENQTLNSLLDEKRGRLQSLKGRYASLEALQQAALGQQDDAEVGWLERHGLKANSRLAERIVVEDVWSIAAETVLGDYLQAVCVDGVNAVAQLLGDFDKGSLNFVSNTHGVSLPTAGAHSQFGAGSLLSKVSSQTDLSDVLAGVYVAQDLAAALTMRHGLQSGESVITADGIWLGRQWLRVSKDQDATAGVLKRQAELKLVDEQVEVLRQEVGDLTDALESGVFSLQAAEHDRDVEQRRQVQQQRAFSETRAQLGAKKLQVEQVQGEMQKTRYEIEADTEHVEEDEAHLRAAKTILQDALDQMEEDTQRREQLQLQRHECQQGLENARSRAREHRDAAHQLALQIQSLGSQVVSTEQAMTRLQEQQLIFAERKKNLESSLTDSQEPQVQLKQDLEIQLERRLEVETTLTQARQKTAAVEHAIREHEQQRSRAEQAIEQTRGSLDQVRMEWQGLDVRRSTIHEQLAADKQALDVVLEGLPEFANEAEWEENLTRIGNRVQRLGAINLAAIDEFKVQSERKEYLDAQNDDLEKALHTLETAIRKIDLETRTRFKETFDKVNSRLQQLFPKVFGGGHAYLEMTGDDLLDTGVGLMARPPGKRNSSIHQLSGGEKALTAIALVFSIFSLNPAPFCMLDEVDAPLDDANVVRYCHLVKEMSKTVQFIYITHNKIAMEMAEQLMGVTMHEPGCSRMVSVDVDEAVAIAG